MKIIQNGDLFETECDIDQNSINLENNSLKGFIHY